MANWNKNSGYGQALINGISAKIGGPVGNVYFVANSSDTDEKNYQHMQEIFTPDVDGRTRFFTSVESAYAAMESNNNDVMILDGNSTHALAATLKIEKDRIHIVGLDFLLGIERKQGQSSKINIGVTIDTDDVAAIRNLGVRNSFRGLKISSSNTLTEGIYAFKDGGEYTYMHSCEVVHLAQLSVATVADLVCNGDSSMYVNCAFGSTANEITANGARPNVLISGGAAGTGKKARDVRFVNCDFLYKAGDTDNRFVYGSGTTDVERLMVFDGCLFYNNLLAAQTMTLGMAMGNQTEGSVILKDSAAYNTTDFATATGIFQACNAANAANGIEVTQSS